MVWVETRQIKPRWGEILKGYIRFKLIFVHYISLLNEGITSSVVMQKLDELCNDLGGMIIGTGMIPYSSFALPDLRGNRSQNPWLSERTGNEVLEFRQIGVAKYLLLRYQQ